MAIVLATETKEAHRKFKQSINEITGLLSVANINKEFTLIHI